MNAEPEIIFVTNPGQTFSTALVALLFSTVWLVVEINHRDVVLALTAAAVIAISVFSMFHSAKWIFRIWRGYLS